MVGGKEKNGVCLGGETGAVACDSGAADDCPPKAESVGLDSSSVTTVAWKGLLNRLIGFVSAEAAEVKLLPSPNDADPDCGVSPKALEFGCVLKGELKPEVEGARTASLFEPSVVELVKLNFGVDAL